VRKNDEESVWLPPASIASTSHSYSVSGRRKPGGTTKLVADGGIVTSSVIFGSAGIPVSG
jgi:hypothetical protein